MSHQYRSLADFEPWEVEAYLDGEDLPHLAAFLAANPTAMAALRAEQARTAALHKTLYRFDCPSPLLLQTYHLGELAITVQRQVTAHLEQCLQCSAEVAALQAFVDESVVTANHPSWLTTLREELTETVQTVMTGLRTEMNVVVAKLVTPNPPPFAALAVRGVPAAPATPLLLFTVDDMEITLTFQQQNSGRYAMDGQIFAATPLHNATFTLTPAEPDQAMTMGVVSGTGTFVVNDLPTGLYQLAFTLTEQSIVIPNLLIA